MAKSKKREKVNYLEYTFTIFEKYNIWQLSFVLEKGKSPKKKTTGLKATPSNLLIIKKEIIPQIVEVLTGKIKNFEDEENKEYTVEEWAEEFFLVYKGTVRPHVFKRNHRHFLNQIKPYFDHRKLESIKPIEIEKWQNKLLEKYKYSTVQKYRSVFLSILDKAVDNDIIRKNPVRKVKSPKVLAKKKDNDESKKMTVLNPFSEKEMEIIISSATGYLRNFIALMYTTGIRPGEIIALRWKDIDFDKKQISIGKTIVNGIEGDTKTDSSDRDVDILPQAEIALKKQFQLTGCQEFVFLSSFHKRFYSHDIIAVQFKVLLKNSGVKVRTLYNLRHTFASQMISKGIDILWVSKMLGHKNPQITLKIYAKYIQENDDVRLDNISKIGANFGANILEEAKKSNK
ncbi:tyrosine-type recombinase/integrase [Sulfurimonas hydrogeniphila]|uniref:tyrosine-type recombinase/integrase n=1 Tax=Sulfurimonas hydrogeniphila TaxID=2509341 RepID=UPI001E638F33|nr:site-specific integrase [Sulfurimonas hydrogeniphila]